MGIVIFVSSRINDVGFRSSVTGSKLTFIVGVLEVVVDVGHKVLHKMTPDIWH